MTKGVGVGTEMFGKSAEIGSKDEIVKPGITREDLERIETRGLGDGPDPFGDVFKERGATQPPPAQDAPPPVDAAAPDGGAARAPLPDQSTLFGSGRAPLPPQESTMQSVLPPSQPGAPGSGLFKTEMCQFWPQGKCTKGENCTYAHSEAELSKK